MIPRKKAKKKAPKKPSAPKTARDLKAAGYNPRLMTPQELASLGDSMKKYGDLSGIVFNRRTSTLIGAHQRRTHIPDDAKIELHGRRRRTPNEQGTIVTGFIDVNGERWGYREVDVSPQIEKEMNLAANRHGEGKWDFEQLTPMLSEMGDLDLLLEMPVGFSEVELTSLYDDGLGEGVKTELPPIDAPVTDDTPKSTCPSCGHVYSVG